MGLQRALGVALAAVLASVCSAVSDGDDYLGQQVLVPTVPLATSAVDENVVQLTAAVAADTTSSRFAVSSAGMDTGAYALADAQLYEKEALSVFLALICEGTDTSFFAKLLREQAFPSNLYLPFGVTSSQVAEGVISALRYGHCQRTVIPGDVPSAVVTSGPAPALSYLIHHLIKDGLLAEAQLDPSSPSSTEIFETMDLANSLIYDEIVRVKAKDLSFRMLLKEYSLAWLKARKEVLSAPARMQAFQAAMQQFVAIATHASLHAVKGAFSHAMGHLCFPEDPNYDAQDANALPVACSPKFVESITRLYLNAVFRQVHPMAVTHEVLDKADSDMPAMKVLRDANNIALFYGAQSVINLIEDPCRLADISFDDGETLHNAMKSGMAKLVPPPPAPGSPVGSGVRGAQASKQLFVDKGPTGTTIDARVNKLTLPNTMLAVFTTYLNWATVAAGHTAPNVQQGQVGEDSTHSATLSPEYLTTVHAVRTGVRAALFSAAGVPLAVVYPQGETPLPLPAVDKTDFTPLKTGFLSYSFFASPAVDNPNAGGIGLIASVKTVARAILMLDAGVKSGIKAGENPPEVPATVLAAAQIAYSEGAHSIAYRAVAPGLQKFSEDKFTFGSAAKKWQARTFAATPDQVVYYEAGKSEATASGLLPWAEMDGIMLPSPTTAKARRDKALDAAYNKMQEGNICGSFLQTPSADLKERKTRRKNIAEEEQINFVDQPSASAILEKGKAGDKAMQDPMLSGPAARHFLRDPEDLDHRWFYTDDAGRVHRYMTPYSASSYFRHSAALYLPDPAPSSRYYTVCTSRPLAANVAPNSPAERSWALLVAKPLLTMFCAAAHNQGPTHRFKLEERFSFVSWALTVQPHGDDSQVDVQGGGLMAHNTDMGPIRGLAGSHLPERVIEALKRHGILQAPQQQPNAQQANAAPGQPPKRAHNDAPYTFSCAELFAMRQINGLSPDEAGEYLNLVPRKVEGKVPWELSPVISTGTGVSGDLLPANGREHPIFARMESLAPALVKETFGDYLESLAVTLAGQNPRSQMNPNSVSEKLLMVDPAAAKTPEEKNARKLVPKDLVRETLRDMTEHCTTPDKEKARLLKREKQGKKWMKDTGLRPPSKSRDYFAVHNAMTAYQRPVQLAVTPAARLMAWLAWEGFQSDHSTVIQGKGPNGAFYQRFRPINTASVRSDIVRVHVSDTDKIAIVTFMWFAEDLSENPTKDLYSLAGGDMKKAARYEETNRILTTVMETYKGHTVLLNGYCFGGATALHFSKMYGLPAYAFNPAPLVDVKKRVTAGAAMALVLFITNMGTLTLQNRIANIFLSSAGGQTAAYWRIVMPRSAFGYEDAIEMWMATHRAVPGVAGLNQVHASAGSRSSAPYFNRDSKGRDVPGYTLFLYPAMCRRAEIQAHMLSYFIFPLPSTTHPAWAKHPDKPKTVTFPHIKPWSKGYNAGVNGATDKSPQISGGDPNHVSYKAIYDMLGVYEAFLPSLPTVEYMAFPRSQALLADGMTEAARQATGDWRYDSAVQAVQGGIARGVNRFEWIYSWKQKLKMSHNRRRAKYGRDPKPVGLPQRPGMVARNDADDDSDESDYDEEEQEDEIVDSLLSGGNAGQQPRLSIRGAESASSHEEQVELELQNQNHQQQQPLPNALAPQSQQNQGNQQHQPQLQGNRQSVPNQQNQQNHQN